MRTGKIEVNGKEYLLCFSLRVVRDCTERYGSVENIADALSTGTEVEQLDECIWLLSKMMEGGARYAKEEGIENPVPLGYDSLYDLLDLKDIFKMKESIFLAVANGNDREVETEPEKGKNAETTQQETLLSGMFGTD